jgi:hypothetical protein
LPCQAPARLAARAELANPNVQAATSKQLR